MRLWLPALLLVALPDDAARRHVEDITAARWEYAVAQGGTMDGVNCRSPLGGGFGIWTQSWESNRSVRLENVGETDLLNPWLSNGRNDFRTVKEIVASAVKPGMSDEERAKAIWRFQTTHRFHAGAGDAAEMHDPVKVLNVYGYTTCGDDSVCLSGLWHAAGFPVSPGRLLGHRTSEVFYDGQWHLMDGDLGPVYLLRDNVTVASEQDLARDHDLVKRSHPHGILDPDRRADNEEHAAVFVSDEPAKAAQPITRASTMNMVLRPGEAIVWRWGKGTRYHGHEDISTWGPRKGDGCVWGAAAAERICNGAWEYRPDFSGPVWRSGAESAENVAVERGALVAGTVVWRMKSPYVFVGGRLETAGSGAKFFLSWDGGAWQPVGDSLDPFFPSRGPARYEYQLKCDLPAGSRLERLAIVNDVQMAPLAMPGMSIGENRFTYSDVTPGKRKVRITHDWVERSSSRPPAAPAAAVWPVDAARTSRTDVSFEWRPVDGAHDYHFELSDRPDFAWPLSSNFEKLVSNTADRGKARYRLPAAGLLSPGRTYCWRVRARNDQGVWGPWSKTWSFAVGGPSVPAEVRLEKGVLRWKGDAVRYRVYGSDEKGFSVGDAHYPMVVGRSKEMPSRMPPNFIAETDRCELAVLGRAHYRVVAVNEAGVRSGPSDYVSAPRPAFVGEPCAVAKIGQEYRGYNHVVRSFGDLRLHWVDGEEIASFWDLERPRFTLDQGPAWLRIHPETGILSGVPDAKGAVDVAITVTLERTVRRREDPGPRPWNLGLYKDRTLQLATESVGSATHRFQITVGD